MRALKGLGCIALVCGFAVATARAQDAVPADSTASDSSAISIEARLHALESQLQSVQEQQSTIQTDTDKLKRFKFSGYLQVRWETAEDKADTVQIVTTSPVTVKTFNRARFYIRRARLKLTYDNSPTSQLVLSMDGGEDRFVRLLDAYITLLDPWTPEHNYQFTIGQMDVPFGYEIERSDPMRELPERSRAENVLFPGERDRGFKIVARPVPWLEAVAGLYNGSGINHPLFPNGDPTPGKDVVGRVRVSFGWLDLAMSGYNGKDVVPLTGPDIATPKTRYGPDAQAYYELPTLGGGTLRGEMYLGEDQNPDSVLKLVTTSGGARVLAPGADPSHLATPFRGGYVMWVQSLGERFQSAVRYDAFDRNVDVAHDQFQRWGFALNYYYDSAVRLMLAYDTPQVEVVTATGYRTPHANLWTVQFQFKF